MDSCVLVRPDLSITEEIRTFREEMLDAGSQMDGTGPLERMKNTADWIAFNRRLEEKEDLPGNWMEEKQFVYLRETDRKIVGMIRYQYSLSNFVEKYSGHIGYSVRPSERRKGYAERMLANCLKLCRTDGLKRVLVTCMPENEGSRRTILANGGVYEGTIYDDPDGVFLERYWIDT